MDGCVDVGCHVQESTEVLEGMIAENGHLEKVVVSYVQEPTGSGNTGL